MQNYLMHHDLKWPYFRKLIKKRKSIQIVLRYTFVFFLFVRLLRTVKGIQPCIKIEGFFFFDKLLYLRTKNKRKILFKNE